MIPAKSIPYCLFLLVAEPILGQMGIFVVSKYRAAGIETQRMESPGIKYRKQSVSRYLYRPSTSLRIQYQQRPSSSKDAATWERVSVDCRTAYLESTNSVTWVAFTHSNNSVPSVLSGCDEARKHRKLLLLRKRLLLLSLM